MNGNLLLVDDEPALVEMMKELLQDDGLTVFTARNGEEGLKVLLQEKIDCVVSDIKMPVMDGLTFIQHVRNEGFNLPFIFYSGHACERLRATCMGLGASDLLSKPHFGDLEESIRKFLSVKVKKDKELIAQF